MRPCANSSSSNCPYANTVCAHAFDQPCEGVVLPSSLSRERGGNAGIDGGAIGDASRIGPGRHERAKRRPVQAADALQPVELCKRIGMVVDAQVERGPFLAAVDQECCGLLAALVAAGLF